MLHLQHVSAEINTAVREGFYVHMMAPAIRYSVTSARQMEDGTWDLEIDFQFQHQYEIVPCDARREKIVDHRSEMDKRRSPDYQPPGGVS